LSLYLMASGVSSLLWAVTFSLLGLALGRTALRALMFTQRLDVRLGLLAIVLMIVLGMIIRRRRTNANALKLAPDAGLAIEDAGARVVAGR
jgi:membrane protein DedA with SNARE-associated domain